MSSYTSLEAGPSAWLGRARAALAAWAENIGRRIDESTPPRRHRMGSWEQSASLRARALLQEAENG